MTEAEGEWAGSLATLLSASWRRWRPGRAMRKSKARTTKRKAATRSSQRRAKPAKAKTKPKPKPKTKPKAKTRSKPRTKSKAKAKPKAKIQPKAKKAPARRRPVALGAVVRIPRGLAPTAGGDNLRSPRSSPGQREMRGIVCAIRDVTSGKPVVKTRGDLGKFVLELLHDMTFDREYSSAQNAGGRGPAASEGLGQAWERVRALIQEKVAAAPGPMPAMMMLADEDFRRSLDGWRLIKVRADSVVVET